jgi:hypothetical protein
VVVASESALPERRWERFAPLTGIVAVVLIVVAFIIIEEIGDTPDDDATSQQYLTYFREEDGSIWAGAWIFLLGMAFFLWFLGTLRATLYRAEAGVGRLTSIAYGGAVAAAVLLSASIATQVSGAIAADEGENLSPQTAETLWWAGDGFFVAATFFLAAFFAASAILALRTRVFPVWFGVVTAIFAVASAVPFISWAVVIFALPLWIIFVATWLVVRRPVAGQASVGPTPAGPGVG